VQEEAEGTSSEAMLARLATLPAGSEEHARLRDRVIEDLLPLATHLAGRFRNRGEPFDDLAQVANLALIKAVDGFDPERGVSFSSYAVPFIAGELKRHFRDKTWHVRVPRRLQELSLQINRATDELTQELGRSPTVADLAARLEIGEE
jgi:RNA polymerase sigma-B factor